MQLITKKSNLHLKEAYHQHQVNCYFIWQGCGNLQGW